MLGVTTEKHLQIFLVGYEVKFEYQNKLLTKQKYFLMRFCVLM